MHLYRPSGIGASREGGSTVCLDFLN
jgi:hypothetical protein